MIGGGTGAADILDPGQIAFNLIPSINEEDENVLFSSVSKKNPNSAAEAMKRLGEGEMSFVDLEEIEEDELPNLNVPRKSTKLNLREKYDQEYRNNDESNNDMATPPADQHFENSIGLSP